ncbi:MAG: hypothetical protein AUJ96_01165 [Armatimonadetes bacterium CG2_30_66_41]|nr:MAG: hypothetical protein AUJ96_01165 [Armatimonadetes bacterium CG2_30_66_41]
MSQQQLRVLVLGAGDRGAVHSQAWKSVPGASVAEIVDVDLDRAKTLAEQAGVPRWSADWQAALAGTDAHILSNALPASLHADPTVAAAERGIHTFCEKPIALTVADAQRMIDATAAHDVQLAFCFQRRRIPAYAKLAELIQAGEIGRPIVHLQASAAEIRPKIAMHDKHGNGGPMVDGWCHFVDIMRIVFGADPVRAFARGFVFAKGHPSLAPIKELAIDTASVLVDFASGDLMSATWTWGMPKGVRLSLLGETLLGPKGAIRVGQKQITLIREGGEETVIECAPVGAPDPTHLIVRDFAEWVRGNGQSDITGAEALVSLKTSLAVLESIESGQPVTLQ